jgi:hypothetical protein
MSFTQGISSSFFSQYISPGSKLFTLRHFAQLYAQETEGSSDNDYIDIRNGFARSFGSLTLTYNYTLPPPPTPPTPATPNVTEPSPFVIVLLSLAVIVGFRRFG